MIRLRLLVLGAGATLALGLAACGNGAPASSGSGTGGGPCPGTASASGGGTADVTVEATDALKFAPDTTTAKVGQTIEWKNTGSVLHNVTFQQSCLTDGAFQPGGTWSIKFATAGTYNYQCTIHPGMTAKLTVTS
ncbi:MAG: cupredoxin domain-containing protein [Candidatus Dormibacteraeota bacterium]|nr:cupredoxin domain-containing protein [Candidatus Dormibacteraeota bacterium]